MQVQLVGYSDVVLKPMDLDTIRNNLSTYKSFADFENDLKLMFDNCKNFNKNYYVFYEVGLFIMIAII